MKIEDLNYIKNTLNWLLENNQEENPEHAFNTIYNSINKIDEAIDYAHSSSQLKEKEKISFGLWRIKCEDVQAFGKLWKYKNNIMSDDRLLQEYNKIKDSL
ncbi:hypothetical protein ACFQ5N_02245 [Lutibacter holmesii]|uniref:Uncharacterized protein n=1 Tax=Lutibacter holmesii TaxID=1137985 RepID=A0ABW3WMV4_9FLAO